MRELFAHEAMLTMAEGEDEGAPGAAITMALCGRLEHEPPCPLAAHHTSVERQGEHVRLRVLLATEPRLASEVRERIDDALRRGSTQGPDGADVAWHLEASTASAPEPHESDHGRRLLGS